MVLLGSQRNVNALTMFSLLFALYTSPTCANQVEYTFLQWKCITTTHMENFLFNFCMNEKTTRYKSTDLVAYWIWCAHVTLFKYFTLVLDWIHLSHTDISIKQRWVYTFKHLNNSRWTCMRISFVSWIKILDDQPPTFITKTYKNYECILMFSANTCNFNELDCRGAIMIRAFLSYDLMKIEIECSA